MLFRHIELKLETFSPLHRALNNTSLIFENIDNGISILYIVNK